MFDDVTTSASGAPSGENLVFSEDIVLKRLVGLSFKNLLFTILTLGLYNFWARTAVRRHVWAGTIINDEPLEYRGRGIELFIGFLLVTFCVLLPASLVIGLAHFFLDPVIAGTLVAVLYLSGMYLSFVALYRARAYLLSRTSWRGIRGHLGPDWGWFFGWSVIGHYLMTFITLGWWSPRMRMKMAYDLWSRTAWGDEKFVFNEGETDGLAKGLYGYYALAFFGGAAVMIVAFGIMGSLFIGLGLAMGSPEQLPPETVIALFAALYAIIIPAIFLAAFMRLPYEAAAYRAIAGKLRIDNLRFKMDVKSLPLFWLSVGNLLIVIFSLGILSPLAQARSWRFFVRRLTSEGSINLAAIEQAASRGPSAGEGLADAMHISVLDGGL
jgi:uncharacterized membrane protein YjgN (DUF898 family)